MSWKFTEIFFGINEKYWRKNQRRKWSMEPTSPPGTGPPGRAWQACGAHKTPRSQSQVYLVPFVRKKNQGEEFIAFYDTETPPPPVLPLEGRSGVRSGLRRGEIVAIIIINLSPSTIPWCSSPFMRNLIVGLLDGDELDEIYHVIELVLTRIDP